MIEKLAGDWLIALTLAAVLFMGSSGQGGSVAERAAFGPSGDAAVSPAMESRALPTERATQGTAAQGALGKPCPSYGTPPRPQGPYYRPGAPERQNLVEPGMPGERLVVSGFVFDSECRSVAAARLEFWQADANGLYDSSGYRLRGYQLTDGEGRFRLETVVPAEHSGGVPHIHVKVTAPRGTPLTTLLYLPHPAPNHSNRTVDDRLLVGNVERTNEGMTGNFHFRLALSR